ncbi:hypothetical protein CERZMDRAFT_108621 [Cercospora zeae-maydis SCOH1-5]|uniref:Uncharacterized protein n=1 Tax=Cercospora zeae-maydis SCOH1-5 TaxID=717836 RepID=A0A6A6FXE4_9PEZI|nr:hypothetical protein CERZMDRAFT_108621 [Cercospora zeae-maydis SCOH1-5]
MSIAYANFSLGSSSRSGTHARQANPKRLARKQNPGRFPKTNRPCSHRYSRARPKLGGIKGLEEASESSKIKNKKGQPIR